MQFLKGFLVVTQISLAADEDDRQTRAEVKDFGNPLVICEQMLRT